MRCVRWVCSVLLAVGPACAQFAPNRYALILQDAPVAARFPATRSAPARHYHRQLEDRHRGLNSALAARHVRVTGAASTLLNAVFVLAAPGRVAALAGLPGVRGIVPLGRYRLDLNRATQLANAPAAWSALGGMENGGRGIKIAILDSGIDQAHPAFQDPSLAMPAGYPLCAGDDCAFTNNKVIVARSYVRQLAAGTSAADSRPDDFSPRDRHGHGTAVASCAAGYTNTGTLTFSGMAPKAWLGNYKVYGSPEVNDTTTADVVIHALEDALADGMDIASFSSGTAALAGPLDSGAACGQPAGVPCDPLAQAFENAARAGLIVVVAAGNNGQGGQSAPTFNSIQSPGDAPSVITVGATTNAHGFAEVFGVAGPGVPSGLRGMAAAPGDARVPPRALTGPLRDWAALAGDGLACAPLAAGALSGAIAFIETGQCSFTAKLVNAQNAGAAGAVFYMADASPPLAPSGLALFALPALSISQADAAALKTYLAANPDRLVTIDPDGLEQSTSNSNQLASFSSLGPAAGTIKPELAATGTSVYMAAQSYDPLGALYDPDGYTVADGTSFSTPLVAGAAALVKQSHPGFTPAQVKSALVNAAAGDAIADVRTVGAGRLDAAAALNAVVVADPAALSFGTVGALPVARQITLANTGPHAVTLAAGLPPGLTVDQPSITLDPGGSATLTIRLSGTLPPPGAYSGAVTLAGAGVSLRIPYLYLVSDGVAANLIPLTGAYSSGTAGQPIPGGVLAFRLVDAYGAPLSGVPVTFTAQNGGALRNAATATDANGVATAEAVLGAAPGEYSFAATAAGMRQTFFATARSQPTISGISPSPAAPGSYIAIYGAGLAETIDSAPAARLPLAIDYTSVSFDVPSAGISVPGHVVYAAPNQVNVQVPWEPAGQSAAQVKVTIDASPGSVFTLPLAAYAPALFGSGGTAARGQVISLYANGLGPVTNPPPSGEPAPAAPLAWTTTSPTVLMGGVPAAVSFSGLAPGFAGLYQINVTVPASLAPGAYPLTVSIGGQTAPPSTLLVQ